MATFEVSKNDSGDIFVIVDDVVCVATAKADQDKGGAWKENLPARIAQSENPRTELPYGELSGESVTALNEAIDALK